MVKKNCRGGGKLYPVTSRIVRKIGGSNWISLPKAFCDKHGIRAGTKMAIMVMGQDLRLLLVEGESNDPQS